MGSPRKQASKIVEWSTGSRPAEKVTLDTAAIIQWLCCRISDYWLVYGILYCLLLIMNPAVMSNLRTAHPKHHSRTA
ncbi:hypothetical protein EJ03DRAFT_325557 [Teratosphaeria nubilosa]|uniref:Uncharacterized protein n=1 Tax=Teratosphaeria nubilosa TaxID=161662 RepID=A0A6G1LG19_9PEZI|nr:hypothetical protein EJ03DRAFT_325557 [Teratosphaeria nubilosa]